MKTLLVFALALAGAFAEEMKEEKMELKPITYGLPLAYTAQPWTYNTLPLAYNTLPLTYSTPLATAPIATTTYVQQPIQTKFVPKEYEVEVKSYELEPVGSECKNMFGMPVPCAKAKRSADEEEEKKIQIQAPITYGLPLAYNTLPLAYNTLPLTYNTLPLTYTQPAVAIKTLEPKIQEIEVPTPVLKQVVEKIPVGPACQNAWGFPVPCNA